MEFRRAGEFAFGCAVFWCGGAFLALAIGRLSAPVVGASAVAMPAIVATPATARRLAARAPQARNAREPRIVVASKRVAKAIVRVALAETPRPLMPIFVKPVIVHRTAAAPVSAGPVRVASPRQIRVARPTAVLPTKIRSHHRKGERSKPSAPNHRYGIAYVRIRRKPERTPEPPIGYVDHPTLVSAEGASQAAPTIAPVQVDLETTHLAR